MTSNFGGNQSGPYGVPYQVPGSPPPPPPPAKGLAIAALVVGVVAFLLGWAPVVGLLAGAGAIVLGALALKRVQSKPMGITGIVLGGLAALTSLIITAALIVAPGEVSDGFEEGVAAATVAPKETPVTTVVDVAPELAPVPDVVGMPVSEAIVALQDVGFTVNNGGVGASDVVSATDPAVGAEVEVGSAIVLVAEPPLVEVPNVVGMAVGEAESALSETGLTINAGGSPDEYVISQQTPAAGEEADEGGVVTVSAAPRPVNKGEYASLSEREFGLIGKDPDAHTGERVVLYSHIFQFDSFTGKCGFMANSANTEQEYSFDYDQNTAAFAGDGDTNCPILDDIIEGDVVKIWATVSGSHEYETQIGGSTTSLLVQVDAIEFVSSGDES